MKTPLTIFILFFSLQVFSQNNREENDVIKEMCIEFSETKNLSDTLRVDNIYNKYLYPYLLKFERQKAESIGKSLYFRLQRECEEFSKFLDRIEPQENWTELNEMPESQLSESELNEFIKKGNFHYLEGNGEKTIVKIIDGFWIDQFPDKTTSKNKIIWKKNNVFELEFIESNNEARNGFSRKGDRYYYKIINIENNYYNIASKIPNQNRVFVFKLYFN